MRGNEWYCTIPAESDLLHPEQEGMFKADAYQSNADMGHKERLRPGDRALVRGTLHQQTIDLENGKSTVINHLCVTSPEYYPAPNARASRPMKKESQYEQMFLIIQLWLILTWVFP